MIAGVEATLGERVEETPRVKSQLRDSPRIASQIETDKHDEHTRRAYEAESESTPPPQSASPPIEQTVTTSKRPSTPKPLWDGRPFNPKSSPKSTVANSSRPSTPRVNTPMNLSSLADQLKATVKKTNSGTLRRGTIVCLETPRVISGTRVSLSRKVDSLPKTKKNTPATLPLSLNVSGDASEEQKLLTKKKEKEKIDKAFSAAKARTAAHARVLSARAKVDEQLKRPLRVSATFDEQDGFRKTPSSRPGSARHLSQHESEHARALESLSRRSTFSSNLLVRKKRADSIRPTMAYGELCPLNLKSEKEKFLNAWDVYEKGKRSGLTPGLPDDPQFSYADPEAARVAMRRWGLPSDEYLQQAERVMQKKRAEYPNTNLEGNSCDDLENEVDVNEADEGNTSSDTNNNSSDTPSDIPSDSPHDLTSYAHAAWGPKVSPQALEERARRYLAKHEIEELVTIKWHKNLTTPSMTVSNSRDSLTGLNTARGTLHLPTTESSVTTTQSQPSTKYRLHWIDALLDHEIGTHFTIAANDAVHGDDLRDCGSVFGNAGSSIDDTRRSYTNSINFPNCKSKGYGSKGAATHRERLVTEEGLACLNTHRCSKTKILYGPALAYYTRYHASKCSFSELFNLLSEHIPSVSARWSACVRSKRGLTDTKEKKACAKDQCYFEGAVRILEARKLLDFSLLHSGKISLEEYADAKQAWLRYSTRKGNVLRRLSHSGDDSSDGVHLRTSATSATADATDAFAEESRKPLGYLANIRGGVSSVSREDSLRSAYRIYSRTAKASTRTVTPHFLEDEETYLAELDELAEVNCIETKDDVKTRSVCGWAPRRGYGGRVLSARSQRAIEDTCMSGK